MKVRWEQVFPGQILDAALSTVPSQVSRTEAQVILEIAGPAPLALYPGSTSGVEILEATHADREALQQAGFDLPVPTKRKGNPTQDQGDNPSDARKWWQFWK